MLAWLTHATAASPDQIAGWAENVRLEPFGLNIRAKLDTGAETSSLNVPEYIEGIEDGRNMVRFKVMNRDGHSTWIEKPVIRNARIRRHFGERQYRPVILIDLCVGNVLETTEVNLVDRSGLQYQLLIGRSFLAENFLVDSGRKYLTSPQCQKPERP